MKLHSMIDILIVEDNPRDVELLLRALRKNNIVNNIHVVDDGEEAIDCLSGQGRYSNAVSGFTPKVVLLDIKLPKIGGLEVLRQIKSNPATRSIPVVMLTTSSEQPDVATAYELGANSYVVKPIDYNQFLEAMNSLGFYWIMVNRSPNQI